jgi:tRNA (mo5U34)-methyltransferase
VPGRAYAPPVTLAERVAQEVWYHTIELPGGVVTPGRYDLRPALSRIFMPASLAGMRCLDVGTRNGFYAFEMERRGASEVVALDLDDPGGVQYPLPRPPADFVERDLAAGRRAFEVAHEALRSRVRRVPLSVYGLGEERVGRFDFAVLGTLLVHLRDPVAALEAVAAVLDGRLLVNEGVSVVLGLLRPRSAAAEVLMERGRPFWWAPNPVGLRRLVEAGGLDVEAAGRPYLIPYGPGGHGPSLRELARRPRQLVLRRGAPHMWLLARTVARAQGRP